MIVADASAVGTFLIPDEAGLFAQFALAACAANQLVVPAHWHVELASLIRKGMRQGRLTDTQARNAYTLADDLAASVEVVALPSVQQMVEVSQSLSLSTYDAAYHILARERGIALLTDGERLLRAAIGQGLLVLRP